jgi:tRNA pseudouridine32 synthase / 23S rRNA pseudouridine746 synthase
VTDSTLLDVNIESGRYHQIRRHLAGIGHPILGDPIYAGRSDPRGLRLRAVRLTFEDPWDGRPRDFNAGGLDERAPAGVSVSR